MRSPDASAVPSRRLRIAMLGMRGIPANYGGLETVAEEVGARLAARGHRVKAYVRAHNSDTDVSTYRGIRRIVLPSLHRKHLDTPSHTAIASMHALIHRSDVVHVFGVGNAPWLPLLRLAGSATVISVDGMDWRRRKWGPVAKSWLERSSSLAAAWSGACVTDSREVARYYAERHHQSVEYIAHGVDPEPITGREALDRFGLEDRGYLLFVGRLTPEKGVHHLIDAFTGIRGEKHLVIVGDGSAEPAYWQSLRARAHSDPRVLLLGPVYGNDVRQLFAHAYVYVQPSEVEGTALSLVEAMGYGNCVVVSNIAENMETVGPAGLTFDIRDPVHSLQAVLDDLLANPQRVHAFRDVALDYARDHYSWERVTDEHEELYRRVLAP